MLGSYLSPLPSSPGHLYFQTACNLIIFIRPLTHSIIILNFAKLGEIWAQYFICKDYYQTNTHIIRAIHCNDAHRNKTFCAIMNFGDCENGWLSCQLAANVITNKIVCKSKKNLYIIAACCTMKHCDRWHICQHKHYPCVYWIIQTPIRTLGWSGVLLWIWKVGSCGSYSAILCFAFHITGTKHHEFNHCTFQLSLLFVKNSYGVMTDSTSIEILQVRCLCWFDPISSAEQCH